MANDRPQWAANPEQDSAPWQPDHRSARHPVPHDGPPDENTGRAWSDAELRDLGDMLLIGVFNAFA
jgi:hypothetical protein